MSHKAGHERGPMGPGVCGGSWGHRLSKSEGMAGQGAMLGQAGPQRGPQQGAGKCRWQEGQGRRFPGSLLQGWRWLCLPTTHKLSFTVSSNFSQILWSPESWRYFGGTVPGSPWSSFGRAEVKGMPGWRGVHR